MKFSKIYTRKLNLIEIPLPIKHLHLYLSMLRLIRWHTTERNELYRYAYIYRQRERVLYGLGAKMQSADSKRS